MSKRAAHPQVPSRFTGEDLLILLLVNAAGVLAAMASLAWVHRAHLAFGTASTGAVLFVALLGLGLGGFRFGALTSREARPLRLLAGLGILAGLWIALGPLLFEGITAGYGALHAGSQASPTTLAILRIALLLPVVLPPAVCLGGLLPLLLRGSIPRGGSVSGAVGLLAGLVLLGACEGLLVGWFTLLPAVGASVMLVSYGGLTVAGALVLLRLRRSAAPLPSAPTPEASAARGPGLVETVAFGAVASGLCVLGSRWLALVVRQETGARVVAFGLLSLGAGLGALLLAARLARSTRAASHAGFLQGLVALTGGALLLAPASLWTRLLPGVGRGVDTLPLAAFALLVPALLAGAWLPLVVGLGQGTPAGAARDTGRRLGALALGLALGGAGVALFVEPGLGLGHGVRAVTLLGVLLGSYGVWTSVPAAAKTARAVYLSVGLGAWALLSFVGGGARPDDYLARGRTLTATYAGREGYLAVIEQGNDPRLEVDGHLRGEARRNHQVMLAHLPMALHPTAKTVAVLGVATGQAARDFLDYDLSSLAAVEAEPAAAEILGRHFDGAWLDDPRVLAVQAEPQAFLRHGRELFDVITLDPGPIFRPGVGSLYAQEFYRRAGARLAPGGLFCQVLPLSYLGLDEARSIVRTFMSEFPASSLWYNTSEFLLIGAREGAPRLSRASLTRLQSQPRLAADLSFSYWGGRTEWLNRPEVLAAGFLAGPRGLALFAADGQVYGEACTALARAAEGRLTSEEPQIVRSLEAVLDSPAVLLDDPSALSLERVLELRRTNLADLAAASLGQEAYERRRRGELANALGLASKAVQANPRNVRAQRLLGDIERERGNEEQALAAYRKALEIDPEDPTLHARLARAAGADDALAHLEEVVRLRPKDVDARLRLAQGREAAGDRGGAVADYRRALKLDPNHAETHYQLANTLSRMEETWTAMDHYGRVIELRPDFAEAYCNLAILRAGRNELDQAIALYRQAIEHDPGLVPAHYNLSIALRKAGRLEEAEAEARRTLELNPRLHAGYDHLGTVLMDQERYGEAVAMYEKALELAPDYRQARQNLEVARRRTGS